MLEQRNEPIPIFEEKKKADTARVMHWAQVPQQMLLHTTQRYS